MQDLRFPDAEGLARQLAGDLANRMRSSIDARGRVCIALSGGHTPVRFLQNLAAQELPWHKVLVTLVDERWLSADDAASNEALISRHLLQGSAAQAYFLPLKNAAASVTEGFMACENQLHEQIIRLDYAVLGMGLDGHTASWFPHSAALPAILADGAGAWCCPVTDAPDYPQRMTLSWSLLSGCRHLFLHFEGPQKDEVYARAHDAAALADIVAMPVRQLLTQTAVPLTLYRTFNPS